MRLIFSCSSSWTASELYFWTDYAASWNGVTRGEHEALSGTLVHSWRCVSAPVYVKLAVGQSESSDILTRWIGWQFWGHYGHACALGPKRLLVWSWKRNEHLGKTKNKHSYGIYQIYIRIIRFLYAWATPEYKKEEGRGISFTHLTILSKMHVTSAI